MVQRLSDDELIHRSLTTPGSFGEIFRRHAPAVFRYLRRRAGDDAAGDLTAEVFASAFVSRKRFRQSDSALPWLLGIATNVLRTYLRSDGRRVKAHGRAVIDTGLGDGTLEVHDRLEARAARDVLAEALLRLSPQQRDILLLSAWAELTPAEIAVALDLRPGTVRSDLHRARDLVATQLVQRAPHLVPDQGS